MPGEAAARGNVEGHEGVEREADFRAWLFLLMSLTATVSFTAGLAPPGGVWSANDKDHGYVAGNPVMRDKFPTRYLAFYYCNTTAFYSSLIIIAMLAKTNKTKVQRFVFTCFGMLCFLSLTGSYVAATAVDIKSVPFNVGTILTLTTYAIIVEITNILPPFQNNCLSLSTTLY